MAKGAKRNNKLKKRAAREASSALASSAHKQIYHAPEEHFRLIVNSPFSYAIANRINIKELEDGTRRMAVLHQGFGSSEPIPMWAELRNYGNTMHEIAPLDPSRPDAAPATIPYPPSALFLLEHFGVPTPSDVCASAIFNADIFNPKEPMECYLTLEHGRHAVQKTKQMRETFIKAMATGNLDQVLEIGEQFALLILGTTIDDLDDFLEEPFDWRTAKDPAGEWTFPISLGWGDYGPCYNLRDNREAQVEPRELLPRCQEVLEQLRARRKHRAAHLKSQSRFFSHSSMPVPPTQSYPPGSSAQSPVNFFALEDLEMTIPQEISNSVMALPAYPHAVVSDVPEATTLQEPHIYEHRTGLAKRSRPKREHAFFIVLIPESRHPDLGKASILKPDLSRDPDASETDIEIQNLRRDKEDEIDFREKLIQEPVGKPQDWKRLGGDQAYLKDRLGINYYDAWNRAVHKAARVRECSFTDMARLIRQTLADDSEHNSSLVPEIYSVVLDVYFDGWPLLVDPSGNILGCKSKNLGLEFGDDLHAEKRHSQLPQDGVMLKQSSDIVRLTNGERFTLEDYGAVKYLGGDEKFEAKFGKPALAAASDSAPRTWKIHASCGLDRLYEGLCRIRMESGTQAMTKSFGFQVLEQDWSLRLRNVEKGATSSA